MAQENRSTPAAEPSLPAPAALQRATEQAGVRSASSSVRPSLHYDEVTSTTARVAGGSGTSTPAREDSVSLANGDTARDVETGGAHTTAGHEDDDESGEKVPLRVRVRYFYLSAFSQNTATGGLCIQVLSVPFAFAGQHPLAIAVFALNFLWWLVHMALLSARFTLYPSEIGRAVTHPREGMHVGAFVLAVALLIYDFCRLFGSDSRVAKACFVLYWLYALLAIVSSSVTPWIMMLYPSHSLKNMMPSWFLCVYPILLLGPIASAVAPKLAGTSFAPGGAITIIFVGYAAMGIGALVSQLYLASFILRLIQYGTPPARESPTFFLSAGIPALTSYALLRLSIVAEPYIREADWATPTSAEALKFGSLLSSLLYLGEAWWFAILSLLTIGRAIITRRGIAFTTTWWSALFPSQNVAVATIQIGTFFQAPGLEWFGTVLVVILAVVWVFMTAYTVYAFFNDEHMHPHMRDVQEPHRLADFKRGLAPLVDERDAALADTYTKRKRYARSRKAARNRTYSTDAGETSAPDSPDASFAWRRRSFPRIRTDSAHAEKRAAPPPKIVSHLRNLSADDYGAFSLPHTPHETPPATPAQPTSPAVERSMATMAASTAESPRRPRARDLFVFPRQDAV